MVFEADLERGETIRTTLATGRVKRRSFVETKTEEKKLKVYPELMREREKTARLNKLIIKDPDDYRIDERIIKLKEELNKGLIICNITHKPIKPYKCLCVDDNGNEVKDCPNYLYHKRACNKYGFTLQEANELLNKKLNGDLL